MAGLEDGELPSSPEGGSDPDAAPYTPLPRPEASTRPRSATNSSMLAHAGDLETRDWKTGQPPRSASKNDSSDAPSSGTDSDSDSDAGAGGKRRSAKLKRRKLRPIHAAGDGDHGGVFAAMAKRYQQDRRSGSGNNVWGSIIQEDSLNSELKSFGVGRTEKDFRSDRGAEAYDYHLAAQEVERGSEREKRGKAKELDRELQKYWDKRPEAEAEDDRRQDAIRAGKKRGVKERLGRRKSQEHHGGEFEDMSIPQPGVCREISELPPELLEQIRELESSPPAGSNMEADGSSNSGSGDGEVSSAPKSHLWLGEELARKLCEPKTELIVGVLAITGIDVALELFEKTREIEAGGGMMIKNGARRRTPGGVFLQLLRDVAADPNDGRVRDQDVKAFFAHSNREAVKKNKKRKGKQDFMKELESFKRKSAKLKSKAEESVEMKEAEEEEEETLKPLPDILSCISKEFVKKPDAPGSGGAPEPFREPDAPPNSVERTLSSYNDDFLSREDECEDIELF